MKNMTIEASSERLDEMQNFITEEMEEAGISPAVIFKVTVSAEEAFINIADYAYGDSTGNAWISIDISCEKTITLTFADKGKQFNPLEVGEPARNRLEDETLGGYGIFMIRKMMDRVEYEYRDGMNVLTMQCTA